MTKILRHCPSKGSENRILSTSFTLRDNTLDSRYETYSRTLRSDLILMRLSISKKRCCTKVAPTALQILLLNIIFVTRQISITLATATPRTALTTPQFLTQRNLTWLSRKSYKLRKMPYHYYANTVYSYHASDARGRTE